MEVNKMDMEGWRFVMDVGIATIAACLLGAILTFIFNTWVDNKGWKKVQEKIGDTSKGSLNMQHEDIKNAIIEKTSNIYTKVDKINDITVKNEALYQNLNLDQKEVRNNINKLVFDWEKTISENKELRLQIETIKSEKQELKLENQRNIDRINNLASNIEKLMTENVDLKTERNNIKEQLSKVTLNYDKILVDNEELRKENKQLTKNVSLAKQMLGLRKDKNKDCQNVNEIENEDDWDLER